MVDDIISSSLTERLERVNGWLAQPAAELTAYLFRGGLSGNVLEFGVFHGKYLALLYYLSSVHRGQVLGVDAFIGSADIGVSKTVIADNVSYVCGDSNRLSLLHADTMSLRREDILEVIAEPISFISVDAGHEAENLLNDIDLAASLVTPSGVIAVDDAFNHTTPGAIEGSCRYFEQRNHGRLAPFAHCYNKLFLTSSAYHAHYLTAAKKFVEEYQERSYCAATLNRQADNLRDGFLPTFFGYEILPFL